LTKLHFDLMAALYDNFEQSYW